LDLGPCSIAKFGCGPDRNLARPFDASNPFEGVADESAFDFELCRIGEVLKLAPAAYSEVRTRSRAPERRGRNHFLQCSASIVLLDLCYPDLKHFLLSSKRDKDDESLMTRYRLAAIRYAFGGDLYDVTDGDGAGLHKVMI